MPNKTQTEPNPFSMWALVVGALAGGALAVLSSSPLIAWLQGTLAARPSTSLKPGDTVDVVIILGYALFRNGSLTEPLKGRVWNGVKAWEQLPSGTPLIFSGAHPGDGLRARTEASAMEQYALQVHPAASVPPTWLMETRSTSTRENALYSLAMVNEQKLSHVLVVTNTFHQLRSYWVFQKAAKELGLQLQVRMAQLPFVGHRGWGGGPLLDTLMDHVDYWRELLAIAYYKARRYI